MNAPLQGSRRILIINDNATIHADFRKILAPEEPLATRASRAETALFGHANGAQWERPAFELASAYQGEEGVRMTAASLETGQPFAMAFVDVRMPPGLDGIETTSRLWQINPISR